MYHTPCFLFLQQYTFSHLLDVVQASEKELSDSLHKLQALLIDGIHVCTCIYMHLHVCVHVHENMCIVLLYVFIHVHV